MNDPHERKRLISRLSKMLDINSLREIKDAIKNLVEEIDQEREVVGKDSNFFGKASLQNYAKANLALNKMKENKNE
jgi:hypothetical protein